MYLSWKQMYEMQMQLYYRLLHFLRTLFTLFVSTLPFLFSEKCEIIMMDVAVLHITSC